MARVRLNLGRLSITDKIARGRHIVTKLTNNPAFPDPHPSLTEVNAALDELETVFGQVQSAKSELTTRVGTQQIVEKKVTQLLTRLGSYVESVAGNNHTLITSAGMESKALVLRLLRLRLLKASAQPWANTMARSSCRGNRCLMLTATLLISVSIRRCLTAGVRLASPLLQVKRSAT